MADHHPEVLHPMSLHVRLATLETDLSQIAEALPTLIERISKLETLLETRVLNTENRVADH